MTWSYTGNPGSSAKDEVRFLIGDTDQCDQLLQDGEIEFLLSKYNNSPILAAVRCCETVIAKVTRLVDESVGQVRVTFSQRMKAFQQLKRELQARVLTESTQAYAGGISRTDEQVVWSNADRVRPSFTRHMMQNYQTSPWITNNWGWPGTWWW